MFHYYQPTRIHFGTGQLNELGYVRKGYERTCFLVTTPDTPPQPSYERVRKLLDAESISVIHFDKVEPNPNVEIVEQGFVMLKEQPASFVLAVGDGGSISTAKAIAFASNEGSIDWDHLFDEYSSPFAYYPSYSEKRLPLLSIPTASGIGSQVTQAAVITRREEKITLFHPDNFSRGTILDPQLMLTLPKCMSAATGLDAFTRASKSRISANASSYSAMDSMEAMRLVIDHLPHVLEDPQNLEFRTNMCLTDTLVGRTPTSPGTSTPRPSFEVIGGIVHLLYEETLAVIFPVFTQHMVDKNKERSVDVAKLFDGDDLYTAMIEFLEIIGSHKELKDFGVSEEDFQEILASPALDYLPFGSREELGAILKDSYA